MQVLKTGLITKIYCEIYVLPKTRKGCVQFAACKFVPGFLKLASIDMNTLHFCIKGAWFSMEDFEFSNPEREPVRNVKPIEVR